MSSFRAALERSLSNAVSKRGDELWLSPQSASNLETAFELARARGGRLRAPGAEARDDDVPIDMQFMGKLHSVDETSHIAHVGAGLRVSELEARLRPEGLSLGCRGSGDLPLGAYIALGAPGRRPAADDPVDQVLCGAEVLLVDGRRMRIRPAPRRAVGPDLLGALLGGRGRLGVAVGLHLIVRPRLQLKELTYVFSSVDDAESACAWARGRGLRAARSHAGPCAVGGALWVELWRDAMEPARAKLLAEVCAERGGKPLAEQDAPAWPDDPPPAPSATLDALAARLDPGHVLSGS